MKREKNRSRNKNKSASRHKNIKVRKKDIKIVNDSRDFRKEISKFWEIDSEKE